MSEQRPAGRLTVLLLGAVIVLGALLIGAGILFLANRTGSTSSDEATPNPAVEDGEPTAPEVTESSDQAEEQPAGEEPGEGDAALDEIARRSESSPTVLVRGETSQGWMIESPDEFGFYPVGPAGPEVFTDTVSSGFAQSPEGAGFAAIHILQRLNPLNPDWRIAAEAQLVGQGAAAFIASAEIPIAESEQAALREALAFKSAWVGWSVLEFDPQAAVLRLAGLGFIDGQQAAIVTDVRVEWLDNDWRLVTTEVDASDLTKFVSVPGHGALDVDMREAFAL